MDYLEFVNAIIKQDSRNIIEKISRETSDLPKQLSKFYNNFEPKDVEIVLNDLSGVKLYPLNQLHKLQNEYKLDESYFIFATKNSDPIAIHKHQIVILAHGTHSINVEVIAISFDEYVNKLMIDMKS